MPAAALAALVVAAFAWWIKGDWEMGWLVWMAGMPVVGAVAGGLAALLLRAPVAFPVFIASLSSVLALWAVMSTPHGWTGSERASAERGAEALADSVARVEASARHALGAAVEVSGIQPSVQGGRIRKRPFTFFPDREPARVEVDATFALGPSRPLALTLEGDSLVAVATSLDTARAAPWVIRQAALERRFDAPALTVGGHGPWGRGEVVAIRLERGRSDWSLLLVRVGGAEGLETIREVSRRESRDGLARAAAHAGREVRDIILHLPDRRGVAYAASSAFDFIGLPVDRRANLRLVAVFEDGVFRYETRDWFAD